jgi:hypothetical protein
MEADCDDGRCMELVQDFIQFDFGINGVAHLGSAFRGLVLLLNVVTSYPKLLTYIIPLGLDYF